MRREHFRAYTIKQWSRDEKNERRGLKAYFGLKMLFIETRRKHYNKNNATIRLNVGGCDSVTPLSAWLKKLRQTVLYFRKQMSLLFPFDGQPPIDEV